MNTTLKAIVATAAAVVSLAAAAAHPGQPAQPSAIDVRQARQEQRIDRAYASGDLSRRELRSLRQGQREIARAETRALADGHLDRRELRQLTALLDQADAQIRLLRRQPG